MYSAVLRHLLYPVGERILGTKMLKYLKIVEETQWWSPTQLKELQNEKLRALIAHAYDNVPYYRRVFSDRGLTPEDIQNVDDLPKLPILTKNDIRQNFKDILAKDFKRWKPFLNATSGSTGEPLRYYVTMDSISINWACTFRGWGWAGYKLGDKRATLGGYSLIPDKQISIRDRVRWAVERILPLSAVDINENKAALYVKELEQYKPRFIYGYPSAIYIFADYLRAVRLDRMDLQAVFTTAEMLLPHHRKAIEERFGCKVFDCYGCYDGGPQAIECPTHRGYHISSEKAIMEFTDENGKTSYPGHRGQIITTDLHNYAMPFIRYAVGDMGTLIQEQCTCGRGLPLMKSIEGRTTDVITFGNGTTLSGPALTLVFKESNIKQYQVVQQSKDRLIIKIIKADGYSLQDTEHFLRVIRAHIGEGIEIIPEFVHELPTTRAGKHRVIVSKID